VVPLRLHDASLMIDPWVPAGSFTMLFIVFEDANALHCIARASVRVAVCTLPLL
jgi:hypothetical protein